MTISTINRKVDQLGSAWEDFKKLNDRRLAEIERKGSADAVTVDHLNKINNALDQYKSKIEGLEMAFNRPHLGGDFNTKAFSESALEHKKAFEGYVRRGVEADLTALEKKALSQGSDPDGGYLVTRQMADFMTKKIYETSPMRQIASVTSVSTEVLDIIQDDDQAGAGWATSETATVSETTTPQLNRISISMYDLVAQPKASQRLIDDATIDIEQWLADKLADIFSRTENTAFISGDGVNKPKGILAYTAGTGQGQIEQIASGTLGVVTADGLIKLYYALKQDYAVNATFLLNRATAQAIRLLKDTTNQYIWQPGLAAGTPDTLMGVPVKLASDMPIPANNALAVALADFKRGYQIVDRVGIRILRDPYTEKPFVKFYTTKRVGGMATNTDAIKLLKLA